jgi:hypothetical protein
MDKDGDRIRFLIANRPEWLQSTLHEYGVDPFSSRYYAKRAVAGGDPDVTADQLLKYMQDTRQVREERVNERNRRELRGKMMMRLPWSMDEPSGYEVNRGR